MYYRLDSVGISPAELYLTSCGGLFEIQGAKSRYHRRDGTSSAVFKARDDMELKNIITV